MVEIKVVKYEDRCAVGRNWCRTSLKIVTGKGVYWLRVREPYEEDEYYVVPESCKSKRRSPWTVRRKGMVKGPARETVLYFDIMDDKKETVLASCSTDIINVTNK